MSEFPNNFDTPSAEKKPDEKDKKDSSGKSTRTGSVPRIPLFERPSEKPAEPSNMMDKLGELFVKREKAETPKADKPAKIDNPAELAPSPLPTAEQATPVPLEHGQAEPDERLPNVHVESQEATSEPLEAAAADERTKEVDEPDTETADDLFHNTEPAENDIGAGEFVLHLNGDTPAHERVIPLHGESVPSDTGEEMTPDMSDAPDAQPVWRTQPEQQHQFRSGSIPEDGPLSGPSGSEKPVLDPNTSEFAEAALPIPNPEMSDSVPAGHEDTADAKTTPPMEQPQQASEQAPDPQSVVGETEPTSSPTTLEAPRPHIPIPEFGSMPTPVSTQQERVYQQQESDAGHTPQTSETTATKQQVEDALYYATKHGQRRGVIAGALFFGGYEHFKHRRREKRQAKIIKNQSKELLKQQKEQSIQTTEHARQLDQAERIAREQHLQAVQIEKTRSMESVPNRVPAATSERRFAALNQMDERRGDGPSERRFGLNGSHAEIGRPERKSSRRLERLIPRRAEKGGAESFEIPQQLEVPAEHRLETSAWHTIEVDAKTGKAVENPTFAYGHEYYRERAAEAVPRDVSRNAAAGEVALVAAAMDTNNALADPRVQDAANQAVADRSADNPSKAKDAKRSNGLRGQSLRGAMQNNGPIWPWVVAFAVVVLLLLFALN